MSEKIPSHYDQPGWQDITIESLHSMIAEDRQLDALRSARIRLEAVQQVQEDIRAARNDAHEEAGISDADWEVEQKNLEEEVKELQTIITTLEHELDGE